MPCRRFPDYFPHNAEETKPTQTKPDQTNPYLAMKTIIRSILLLSLTATVLGLSSCQTAPSDAEEMPRMNRAGMRMR